MTHNGLEKDYMVQELGGQGEGLGGMGRRDLSHPHHQKRFLPRL